MSTDPQADWRHWHEQRVAAVASSYGPLSLAGTYWLTDYSDGRIPAVPGLWRVDGDEVTLTAGAEDAVTVDGKPLIGTARLTADHSPIHESRAESAGRRLVLLRREGEWAVRDFDPELHTRRTFQGIEATPYDERWVVPGTFRPYERARSVRVENADGKETSPSNSTAPSTSSRSRSRTTARSGRSSRTPPAAATATASASCAPPPRPRTAR
jgi:uncharacterized protein (DUF1684 family)